MAQSTHYSAFDGLDDWQDVPTARPPHAGPALASLSVVDPFEEAVFPTVQTPVKMKPRLAAAGQTAQKAAAPAATAATAEPASSPARKRCAFAGCASERFARGYCALHLSDVGANAVAGVSSAVAPTPTTRIRNKFNLWSKQLDINRETLNNECRWTLLHNDDQHTVTLSDNTFAGTRVVKINKQEVYRGQPEPGAWKLDATVGHSFKDSINLRVLVSATPKGYEYELYVDNGGGAQKFDDAHAAFLSKLSHVTQMQRLQLSEQNGAQAVAQLQGQQLRDAEYIKKNWGTASDEEKTAMGGLKSRVSWSFTIRGGKHVIVLEYHAHTGKRKVVIDGDVLVEKKPNALSVNKHKRWSHKFLVGGVACEVRTGKNKKGIRRPGEDLWGPPRPFLFDLLIDSVPFEACQQTETDLAGGNIEQDAKAQQAAASSTGASNNGRVVRQAGVAASQVAVQGGRRNSVHKPLTAEEYEQQSREQNERERREEQQMKEERAKQAATKAAAPAGKKAAAKEESSDDSSSSSSDDSSDSDSSDEE